MNEPPTQSRSDDEGAPMGEAGSGPSAAQPQTYETAAARVEEIIRRLDSGSFATGAWRKSAVWSRRRSGEQTFRKATEGEGAFGKTVSSFDWGSSV